MMIALLALIAALQTQAPSPPLVQVAALRPATPVPASTSAPPASASAVVEANVEAEAEPDTEDEAVEAPPRTREVCRYVEVTGRRFPERRCRTVVIED
jgi:hypothetical protein